MSVMADGTKKFGPAPNPNPVFICAGDCGRLTRPTRMKAENAPEGSVTRKTKTMCWSCDAKFAPPRHRVVTRKEPSEDKTLDTMKTLDRWAVQRNARLAARLRKAGL